jgi:hypothetical protein
MTEKANDVYLSEIRYSIDKLGLDKMILLPLEEAFSWDTEPNIPSDLIDKKITEHNHLSAFHLENLDTLINDILARCTAKGDHTHYQMLYKQRSMAKNGGSNALIQRTGDIYSIPLEERWKSATRISVLSIGCGALSGAMAPIILRKYTEGTSFRFISVDHLGESAQDTLSTKINSFMPELESEYLLKCESKIRKLFEYISTNNSDIKNEVEYRATSLHLTCTIHIVEHENQARGNKHCRNGDKRGIHRNVNRKHLKTHHIEHGHQKRRANDIRKNTKGENEEYVFFIPTLLFIAL